MPFRVTRSDCGRFGKTCCAYGCASFGGEVSAVVGPGSAFRRPSASCCLLSKSCTPIQTRASTPESEAGTVCVSSASTGLCGGQRVTAVPTATSRLFSGGTGLVRPDQGMDKGVHLEGGSYRCPILAATLLT